VTGKAKINGTDITLAPTISISALAKPQNRAFHPQSQSSPQVGTVALHEGQVPQRAGAGELPLFDSGPQENTKFRTLGQGGNGAR
jgi:hypothetical protein